MAQEYLPWKIFLIEIEKTERQSAFIAGSFSTEKARLEKLQKQTDPVEFSNAHFLVELNEPEYYNHSDMKIIPTTDEGAIYDWTDFSPPFTPLKMMPPASKQSAGKKPANKKTKVCRFWKNKMCKYGDKCIYLHP